MPIIRDGFVFGGTLYGWKNDSLKEIDKIKLMGIMYENDEKSQSSNYEVTADKIVLGTLFEVLGEWIGTKKFYYDETGFKTEDESYLISSIIYIILSGAVTFSK